MGTIVHNVVVVAVESSDHVDPDNKLLDMEAFRQTLPEEWRHLVVGPISGMANGTRFYAFMPDGSKMGWGTSELGHAYRKQFVKFFEDELKGTRVLWEVVNTTFGEGPVSAQRLNY